MLKITTETKNGRTRVSCDGTYTILEVIAIMAKLAQMSKESDLWPELKYKTIEDFCELCKKSIEIKKEAE